MSRVTVALIAHASAFALLVLSFTAPAQAQSDESTVSRFGAAALGAATIEGSVRYSLKSASSGQQYLIDVLQVGPVAPGDADEKLPVIYVLDGNGFFPFVAQSADWLGSISGEMPAALIVGIGYPLDESLSRTENLMQRVDKRAHDFTPTAVEFGSSEAGGTTSVGGGAGDFSEFIEQTVKPFIAANYPVDSGDQTLVGHSLGGLFTLYMMFDAPESFTRYVASSPSLWWDGRALFDSESSFADSGRDISARLFVSVGTSETEQMISDAGAMVARLKARRGGGLYPGLDVTFRVFDGEDHTSVIPAALMGGLHSVFTRRQSDE